MNVRHIPSRKLAGSTLVLAAAAAASLVAHGARGAEISINPYGNGTGTQLTSGESAGVSGVAAGYWNNVHSGPNFGPVALTDSTGTSSGATITAASLAGNGSGSTASSDPSTIMMAGYVNGSWVNGGFHPGTGNPSYLYVNSLSSAYTSPSYAVYVYFNSPTSASFLQEFELYDGGTITTGSGTYSESGGTSFLEYAYTGNNLYSGSFTQATGGDTTSDATAGNYVEFTGLTAGNFTLMFADINSSASDIDTVSGIQIVPTPEPGSLAIAGVFGALALLRRRVPNLG